MDTTAIFNSLYAAIPQARARIRVNSRDVIEQAATSGITVARVDTDNGLVDAIEGEIRYRKADEPTRGISLGDVIEIELYGTGAWTKTRVGSKRTTGTVIALSLESEFAQ